MRSRIVRPLLAVAGALLIAGGLGASGAQAAAPPPGVVVEVGAQLQLRALVLATVPVRLTCPAAAGYTTVRLEAGLIEQAAGPAIARSNMDLAQSSQPLVCDGTAHQNSFTALADPTGPPFHAGAAALRLAVSFCDDNFQCVTDDLGFLVASFKVVG